MNNVEVKLRKRIAVAAKHVPADLVITNGKIVNVFTGTVTEGDLAIADGVIVGIGSYEGIEGYDAEGRYIVPGLIDGHVHIESSMLAPKEFAKVLLLHGVTTAITDPHEIANVAGAEGIDYMLSSAEQLPLDIFVMLPSSVPVTPFESSGAKLEAEQLQPYYAHSNVLGLAEVMDFPSVSNVEITMLKKLAGAQSHLIDGHAAGMDRESLNIYMAAGIRTDHESISVEEARDRLELGMYLMIREGTVAKNLDAVLPAVTLHNSRRCVFVTDDKLLDDLVEEGSIDHIVRLAIKKGLAPVTAIQMATINTAECFNLRDRGAVAPGYLADFLVVDELDSLSIHAVYKRGLRIVDQGSVDEQAFPEISPMMSLSLPKLNAKELELKDLNLPLSADICNVIEIVPNQIVTHHRREAVDRQNGLFQTSIAKDQLKLAVVERHRATGNIGLGIVKGFQFSRGAIASSVSHDSHNIVIAGVTDEDMLIAFNELLRQQGGLVVVSDGEVLASLSLPVAGLMSERPYIELYQELKPLNQALSAIGAQETFNPFLTLSFLTLPVIPQLKLTDKGLFDFEAYRHIPVQADMEPSQP
ncbi:adenine deaminase [Paenibacillus sp. R14(2021)]|uniref:adenine deaminase n=1 Tax=Paenibacillus sp. R14(2021) TaxID=2859228 RepID=UPI001C6126C6|nr:adenine deaminase [Paenibacillus sp. R14(2021)]